MKAELHSKEMKRIIECCKNFTRIDVEKMKHIYLKFSKENKEVCAIALDGHRISVEYAPLETCDEDFTCYINPVKINIRSIYFVKVEKIEENSIVTVGNVSYRCEQPAGDFFKIDGVIDDILKNEVKAVIGVSAKYMADAMSAIAKTSYPGYVAMEIRDEKMPIIIRENKTKNLKIVLPVKISDYVPYGSSPKEETEVKEQTK